MQIRPIKTKTDHRAALKEIERLMDAKPGTPAGDRLEVLTTLVERYESLHEPIEPPNPVVGSQKDRTPVSQNLSPPSSLLPDRASACPNRWPSV
jgi:hypothetical protein